MRGNIAIFWVIAGFLALSAAVYAVWNWATYGEIEWAGFIGILFSAILGAFIAFYLGQVYRAQGGELPEDRLDAQVDDGDPEMGHFSPWSWWPILFAAAAAVIFTGLAVSVFLVAIGVPLLLVTLVGWVYEYYRGNFAR